MQAGPIHPITLEKAKKGLWERLAANAKLDPEATGEDSSIADADREEQLERLWSEADEKLLGLLIVDDLRAWAADGDNWKLLPPRAMIRWATRPSDEPSGVYIDRQEFAAALENRWPAQFGNLIPPSLSPDAKPSGNPKRRGRTRGSGSYVEDDAPLLLEMRELIRTRKARSPTEAGRMVAGRAVGGGTPESRATRLAKRYREAFGSGA